MSKSDDTKQNIIASTITLIEKSNGNVEEITIRKIAETARVGTGLVNHYFQSKEKLIEICVQSIISNVIQSFRPRGAEELNPVERTKRTAIQVMDFLMENRQISRISILSDMKSPKKDDNTMGTIKGLGINFKDKEDCNGRRNAFILTVALQSAFLRKDILKSSLGIDFHRKEERDAFIEDLVERIGGNVV